MGPDKKRGAHRATRHIEPEPPRRRSPAASAIVLVVIAALGWILFIRATRPGEVPGEVLAAGAEAGCGPVERPVTLEEPSRRHLDPSEELAYRDPPAAGGPHDPSPLPPEPRVYDSPVSEARGIHNLEHAYVLVYYRPSAEGGLSPETIEALEGSVREQARVIMAPYPNMPSGEALVLLAWNTRWVCPNTPTPDQAVTIAEGFIEAFRGTTVAPEAPRGLLGPLLLK